MIKSLTLGSLLILGTYSAVAADPYKVQAPMPEDANGAMAFIINFDTGEKVDSILVEDNTAVFKGTIEEPFAARIIVDGQRYSQFILEAGSIAIDNASRRAFGSPLNDAYREIETSLQIYPQRYQQATTEAEQEAIVGEYNAAVDSIIKDNIDNPIGYLMFLQQAYELEPAELVAFLETTPSLKSSQRLSKLVEMNARKEASGEGKHFIDFEADGHRLSEFVGRDGKYLLVDYFASWCRPCREQIVVLKDIYEKYKGSGKLDILGVAVWDDPDDTRRAITSEQIPWQCLINAGSVPTDLYGISGIPCIMLIAPDGTIVSRDKMGDDLVKAVDDALSR